MIVHIFPVVDKKGKRFWLVSRSAGRQLRGTYNETLPAIMDQWTKTVGKIDEVVREKEMSLREAEQKIDQMRRLYLEKRDKKK